jgi:hypothetical protein
LLSGSSSSAGKNLRTDFVQFAVRCFELLITSLIGQLASGYDRSPSRPGSDRQRLLIEDVENLGSPLTAETVRLTNRSMMVARSPPPLPVSIGVWLDFLQHGAPAPDPRVSHRQNLL